RGENVGVIERNNARIESNEAAEACRQVERRLAATSRHSDLLRRRIALDATRARIVRHMAMTKSILDHVASVGPAIALRAHMIASAGRVSKVIAVRRRADAIAAVKPKLTTARA
ncbi:hypothetical protein LZC13_10465, partial [Campylobacter coli]|nr:hypothetical protein [Campylobacter coli]